MSNLVYPNLQGATFPVVKRPIFNTIVQEASSGLEVRIGLFTWPLYEWELPYSWLSQEAAIMDFQTLSGFFNQMYGQFDTFLFQDPNDNGTIVGSPTPFATADGVTTVFQMGRTLGGFIDPIGGINAISRAPSIYFNSTLQSSGYTINNNTGVITFSSAPTTGLVLKADFDYYWRVRMAEDKVDFSNFVNNWWEAKKMYLRSVRAQAL